MPKPFRDRSPDITSSIGQLTSATPGIPEANIDMIRGVMAGRGPDKQHRDPEGGARPVANMAAVHVPDFCQKGYLNAYDLERRKLPSRVGGSPPRVSRVRKTVDAVLKAVASIPPEEIYFVAVEVNGSGIRFYGDICLVLKWTSALEDTVVLETNSYDLARPPRTLAGQLPDQGKLTQVAQDMAGTWSANMPDMAVEKVMAARRIEKRRLTTGQVSSAVLDDEDYLEVLRKGSFRATDLQEARVSALDAAAEEHVGARSRLGSCPSLAELQWRKHRRAAVKALDVADVRTRVVTTAGRVRS